MPAAAATAAGLGWALGGYGFTATRSPSASRRALVLPKTADKAAVRREARAVFLVRDLVNDAGGGYGAGGACRRGPRRGQGRRGPLSPSSSATSC